MTHIRTGTALGTAGLLAAMLLVPAGAASADLTTRCVGEGGAVTIPNDLVVPAGQTCSLDGTVVQGDVRVGPGADLLAEDATIEGEVRVASDGYLDVEGADLADRVILRDAFGAYLVASSLGDDLVARPGDSGGAGFLSTDDIEVDGSVRVVAGQVVLDASEVTGDLVSRDSAYTDVYGTFIDGAVRLIGNEQGAVVCTSVIQGESRIVDNDSVQLGGDGPLVACDGTSYWGSDVLVAGTTDGVGIDDNIVNGDLVLRDNDPVAQVGDGNMVRGEVIGEFESMEDDAPGMSAMSSARAAVDVGRQDALDAQVTSRRRAAVAAAAEAGDAFS